MDRDVRKSPSDLSFPADDLNDVAPRVNEVEQVTRGIVNGLDATYKTLVEASLRNNDISETLDQDLAFFRGDLPQHMSAKPTVFLGSSGCGRSSTMNSLLGLKGAIAVSSSGRGTYVPHEYRAAAASQLSPYKVVTSYRSSIEVDEMAKRHHDTLAACRPPAGHIPGLGGGHAEGDESDDNHEIVDDLER